MKNFIDLFSGLERAHGCTYVEKKSSDGTKIKGKSFVKREPVNNKLWEDHLKGIEPSLGIIPIDENNQCRWGCIDVDKYNLNHKKIINLINNHQLPLTLCRSKSGGAHIFLFTTVPVEAKLMRDRLTSISAFLGFGNAEVFPKQVELKSEDDTGNFLNLPYFNSAKTTRYAFNFKGEAITLSQFFLAVKRLTPEELEKLELKRPQSEFNDGPPCIESLTQNKLNDGRDRVMYQYIQYAKRKWPEEWTKHINAFNYKYFDPPLDDRVIQDKIKYHEKRDLGFKCNEEPMCDHCDKKLCMTRKFGIRGQSLFPDLSDLQKINLEEPYYYVNVDGERVKLKDTSYLQEQRLFQRAVMEQVHKVPPTLRKKDFNDMVKLLFTNIEIIEAPKGSSKVEQLLDHLEEYCTDRTASGATKEDMLLGNVWTNEGQHHFIFREFYNKYLLKRRWIEKYDETQMLLKDKCGCEIIRETVGKKKKAIMIIDEFEKTENVYRPKEFKQKDAF
jgi:hypothetical protein|tara:strand:- start:1493 stop:2992 length:1500 start_codon:yes stop_codon:yes gene_type:complete